MKRSRWNYGVLAGIVFAVSGAVPDIIDRIAARLRADDAAQPAAGKAPALAAGKPALPLGKAKKTAQPNLQQRVQRAQARRLAVQLDDQFGPGASQLAASSSIWGQNVKRPGTNGSNGMAGGAGWGGSSYGGSSGFGYSPATGYAIGAATSTGVGSGQTASAAGTSAAQGSRTTAATSDLNMKVLEFAQKNLGKQVGNGQCWTLAAEALAYAGAQPANGYVFGDVVALSQAEPGDIMQFYNVHLVGAGYWMVLGAPHHTAIIQSIDGQQITMLNQDVNNNLRVQVSVINLADYVSGTITVYRPVAASSR
jgi:hypothetical protein